MTTPGQQLDANTDAIALLQAKVQSLAEQVAAHSFRIEQNIADIADLEQRLDELEVGEVLPPINPEPPTGNRIIPGPGWYGPTPTPAAYGGVTERAIAHWNVVPEQTVGDGFTVGVLAHHLDGIDRVEISINGGRWVKAVKGFNPRTLCDEYYASINISSFIGDRLQLRAIAYPVKGQPFVVKPLGTEYENQDLTLYTREMGSVIKLPAGEHNLDIVSLPKEGWLTIEPEDGVARERVILVGEHRGWSRGRLRLRNITQRLPWGNAGMQGKYRLNDDNKQVGNHVWYDGCVVRGADLGSEPKQVSSWIAHQWETATYTDCELGHISKVFFSTRSTKLFARNLFIHDVYEDVFNAAGVHVGIEIKDLDRQPIIDAWGLTSSSDYPHPDLWQYKSWSNTIVQDVLATENINAQGFFIQSTRVKDVAVSNVSIETVSPWRVFHPQVPIDNWLIEESVLGGGVSTSKASLVGRFVSRNNTQPDGSPWLVEIE